MSPYELTMRQSINHNHLFSRHLTHTHYRVVLIIIHLNAFHKLWQPWIEYIAKRKILNKWHWAHPVIWGWPYQSLLLFSRAYCIGLEIVIVNAWQPCISKLQCISNWCLPCQGAHFFSLHFADALCRCISLKTYACISSKIPLTVVFMCPTDNVIIGLGDCLAPNRCEPLP